MAEADWMTSVLSHELRTPLTGLRAVLQLLVENRVPADREREYLLLAMGQVDRLVRLACALSDWQDLEGGRDTLVLDMVDLDLVVQSAMDACQTLAAQRQVSLELDLPVALPKAQVDADRLCQVFLNLVSNAVNYTPAGGQVLVGARLAAAEVRFHVRDQGPGIPSHLLPCLFEPFANTRDRSRPDSVGMGLAIAQRIVHLHGGRIWVESQEGQGSTFQFTVPVPGTSRTEA